MDDDSSDHAVLLAAAAAGDSDAFRRFYLDTVDLVSRFIGSRTGSDMTEDLVSDTYVRALRAAGQFTDTGRPAVAWLITIARNVVASHYRAVGRPTAFNTGDARLAATPEDHVEQHADEAEVLVALAELPPRQREILVARFMDGRSVSECAARLGMTEQAVRAMTYRGLQALRVSLDESPVEVLHA